MLEPAALPAELFDIILECLTQDESKLPHLLKPDQIPVREVNLRSCSLVNHAWHAQSTARLYSAFKCTGVRHSFSRLWHFLRTVVEDPALGAFVQHLDLRESEFWINNRRAVKKDSREQRLKRKESRALFDPGRKIGYKCRQLSKALRWELSHPFIIILISCLPNVSTLYLSLTHFGGVEYDCLCRTLREPWVLPKLDDATFFYSFSDRSKLRHNPCFWIENPEELFSLPSLRKLALFDLHVHAMSKLIDQNARQISPITHLTIVPGGDYRLISSTEKETLKACLQLPRTLVSLTLYLPHKLSMGGDRSPSYMIPNDQLWDILRAHKHSLEYLDLYDLDALFNQGRFQQKPHLGLMSEFKHLCTLRIQPEVLQGGVNGILKAPYRLRHTLPASLQALTLYSERGLFANLQDQLTEVVRDPVFAKLRFLTLPHRSARLLASDPEGSYKDLPLYQLCQDHGVLLRLLESELLPMGGRNLLKRAEAYDPEGYVLETLADGD